MSDADERTAGFVAGVIATIAILITAGFIYEGCHDTPLLNQCKQLAGGNHLGSHDRCEVCTPVEAGAK